MPIFASAGTKKINCRIGDSIMGQLYIRKCKYIMDDLEANCVFLSDGDNKIIIIGCDLATLLPAFAEKVRKHIEKSTGVPSENIYIFCTHTHTGPNTAGLLPDDPINKEYLEELEMHLADLAGKTVSSAREAKIAYGKGKALIGYNRRVCWMDGSHTMYGNTKRPDFAGIEGPEDPTHCVISIVDKDNKYIAIIHNNACHSTCVESENLASADYPGEARRIIRHILDIENLPVVYIQGASGDLSPWDLMNPDKRVPGVQRMREIGATLASETMNIIAKSDYISDTIIKTATETISMKVRIPDEKEIENARKIFDEGEQKSGRGNYVLQWSILELYNDYKDNPFEEVSVNAIRIGDCCIATNPYEYYCQFGVDIRRRSPSKITMIGQLANGWYGYCPTIYGVMGGGYSGMTIYWTRHEPLAGYKVADASARLLHKLWH
jgi:hypothetical protein